MLKDFVNIAGELGVSHFLIYTKSDINVHLRMCRLPRGPTLTFRVHEYTLCKDIVSALKKPNMDPKQFNHHPLLVMNNFTGEEMHLKLMSTMFQNMFPSININKVDTLVLVSINLQSLCEGTRVGGWLQARPSHSLVCQSG